MTFSRLVAVLFLFFATLPCSKSSELEAEAFVLDQWPGYKRGPAFDVFVTNQTAYVAFGYGISVIDVTAPSNPARITNIQSSLWGWIEDFAIDQDTLVLKQYAGPLQVYDIANPTNPVLLSEESAIDSTPPSDIALQNGYAYLLGGGLQVVDLTNRDQVVERGFVGLTNALSIVLSQNIAYVLCHTYGFVAIDISNPDIPQIIGEYPNGSFGERIALVADTILIEGAPETLGTIEFVDVSNPRSPRLSSVYQSPAHENHLTYGLPANSQGLFVVAARGLEMFDLTSRTNPVLLGSALLPAVGGNIATDGSYAFVSDYQAGLHIYDIRVPSAPAHIAELPLTGSSFQVRINNNHAFLCDGMEGLKIFDLAHPSLKSVARIPNTRSDYTTDIAIKGNYAFVAEQSAGLKILDIALPTTPRLVGRVEFIPARPPAFGAVYAHDVKLLEGDKILVSNSAKFFVFDIKSPSSPQLIATQSHSNTVTDVTLVGTVAYMSSKGLRVVDFSDPSRPLYITNFVLSDSAYELTASSNYVYLPAGRKGLLVFDATEPKHPKLISTYTNGVPSRVTIAGNLAFVADRFSPVLELLDVRNPSNLVSIARRQLPYIASHIAIDGNRAFLSCGENGLVVIDLSDILGPALVLNGLAGSPVLEIFGRPGRHFILHYQDSLPRGSGWISSPPSLLMAPRQSIPIDSSVGSRFFRASWKD